MEHTSPTAITDPVAADRSPLALLRRYFPGPGALLGLVLIAAPLVIGGCTPSLVWG